MSAYEDIELLGCNIYRENVGIVNAIRRSTGDGASFRRATIIAVSADTGRCTISARRVA